MMQLLPTLQSGLDVNLFFTKGIYGIDETDALKLFQLVKVPLVHGWLADPSDQMLYSALDGLSFNSAQLAQVDESLPEEKRVLIQAWLESSDQLTYTGLQQLYTVFPRTIPADVPPVKGSNDVLGVLFCNNHFSTICFHQGRLYSLVTDVGFADRSIVWELIHDTKGDNVFFREDFTPYNSYSSQQAYIPPISAAVSIPVHSANQPQTAPQPVPKQSLYPSLEEVSAPPAAAAAAATAKPPVAQPSQPPPPSYDLCPKDPYASQYVGNSAAPAPRPTSTTDASDEALARKLYEQERQQNKMKKEQEDEDLALAIQYQQQEEAAAKQAQANQQYYYRQSQMHADRMRAAQQQNDCLIQ